MRTGTRAIVARRLDHLEDGGGMVCIDWVDRDVDLPQQDDAMAPVNMARLLWRDRTEGDDR